MENQRISLFKQKNRWGMTIASIVLCLVVSPVLGLMLFLPQIATVLPVVLMALLGFAGPVSAAACSAVLIALCASLFGVWGAVVAALFFVPVVIVSALAVDQGRAFWPSVAVGGVAMFASMGAVMALLSFLAGSDIVSAISQMTRQMFDMSGALGDSLLSMMMQLGLITAQDGSSLSMTALDSATREQLVSSIVMMMDSVLRLEIPMQMATGSVAAGCSRAGTRWITRRCARGWFQAAGAACWASPWWRCICWRCLCRRFPRACIMYSAASLSRCSPCRELRRCAISCMSAGRAARFRESSLCWGISCSGRRPFCLASRIRRLIFHTAGPRSRGRKSA